MWILCFAQLAEECGLFGTLFHVQINCSRFVEHISLKVGIKSNLIHFSKNVGELIAKLSTMLNFSWWKWRNFFLAIVFWFKLKKNITIQAQLPVISVPVFQKVTCKVLLWNKAAQPLQLQFLLLKPWFISLAMSLI